jgi:hypothetical protein
MAEGVSIVLSSLSEAGWRTTLSYLRKQVTSGVPWEILLLNSASDGAIAAAVLSSWEGSPVPVRVLRERRQDLHRAPERSLTEATYDVLGFVDEQSWISPNWVQVASETFTGDPSLGAAGSICEPVFDVPEPPWFSNFHSIYGVLTESDFERQKESYEYLNDAGLCVRKRAWVQLIQGGFCSLLSDRANRVRSTSGNMELALAIRLAGWKTRVEPRLRLSQFVPTECLHWRFLRRLHRNYEASRILLDAYSNPNLSMRLGLTPRLAQLWWYQLARSLTKLAGRPKDVLRAVMSKGENRSEVLEVEILLGRILGMLRLRSRYGWARRHVRYAPWRLRRPEEYLRNPREARI